MKESAFYFNDEIELKDLGFGVSRKILAHNSNMMMVEVHFNKDSIGTVHEHPHTQCTYVLKGTFRFSINNEEKVVKQGDTIVFEGGVKHGTVCLEEGVVLDVFTPPRQDFLQ